MRRLSEGVKSTSGIGGHGYKDNDVMTRGQNENMTRYSNLSTSATKSRFI